MDKICNNCSIILNENNAYASDIKNNRNICKDCKKTNRKKNITPTKEAFYSKIKRLNIKEQIISAYGGKCVCCGQNIWQFLAIDHCNNDGAKHRKDINKSGGAPFYNWLKKNNYPRDDYRLLCHNCNCALSFYGFCPHNINTELNSCEFCYTNLSLDNMFEFHIKNKNSICKNCVITISPMRKTAKNIKIKYRSLVQRRMDNKSILFKIKLQLIEGYGGKCSCCGEDNYLFLTIDHVFNDGYQDRKEKKYNQYNFYKQIINENFPTKYRLLCYNCNCCRGFYGKCYHELCRSLNKEHVSIGEYKDIIKEG